MSCSFNFKKDATVYVVHDTKQYMLDLSEISFNQSLMEVSYSNKSIQVQNMFEQSIIKRANIAHCNLTFPALEESDLRILFDRALDYDVFNLYVETEKDVFLIENCVVTNMGLIIERLTPLSITISSEASKVSVVGKAGEFTIPGTPQARSVSKTFMLPKGLDILLAGSLDFPTGVTDLSIELNNGIKWTPWTTVDDALIVGKIMYPSKFTLGTRVLSGTITHLEINTPAKFLNVPLTLTVGGTYGFGLNIASCAVTSQIDTGEIFKQTYSWRSLDNPTDLTNTIIYRSI